MIRRMIAIVAIALTFSVPLRAELKYTMTLTARPSTVPPAAAPPNPLMAVLAQMLSGTLLPTTPVVMTTIVGPLGIRTEFDKAYVMIPAGGVTIVKPDGTYIVMDPAKQTYWKTMKPDPATLGITPIVTSKPTTERATIAGLDALKSIVEIKLPLPTSPGTQLPPGLPTEFLITAEAWLSAQHKSYVKQMSLSLGALGILGIEGAALGDGFPARVIVRGELLGGQELEYVVTAVAEASALPALFEIPEGYKEVPPPPMGIGGIGGRQ